jgi:hypothetical protein
MTAAGYVDVQGALLGLVKIMRNWYRPSQYGGMEWSGQISGLSA